MEDSRVSSVRTGHEQGALNALRVCVRVPAVLVLGHPLVAIVAGLSAQSVNPSQSSSLGELHVSGCGVTSPVQGPNPNPSGLHAVTPAAHGPTPSVLGGPV